MRIDMIPTGENPPENLNVIIEVPLGGEPVKYEFDKASGALFVDRILHTPMRYPANYGFVPHTLSPDGEKLVCVPDTSTFPYYANVREKADLPGIVCQQIEHFFTHYKDLEEEKWVRVGTWGDADEARRIVIEAIERAQSGS
jgi:inorganic pyrophosphatase